MVKVVRLQSSDFDLLEQLISDALNDDAHAYESHWTAAPFEADPDLRQRLRPAARNMSHAATYKTRMFRRPQRVNREHAVNQRVLVGPLRDLLDPDYAGECVAYAYRSVFPSHLRPDVYVKTSVAVCAYVFDQELKNWRRAYASMARHGLRHLVA
jgi:hypothetical protein